MTKSRDVHYFDYVNHPYAKVKTALSGDSPAIFSAATKSAASRAKSLAAELHVNIAGIEVGTDIAITVTKIEEEPAHLKVPAKTVIHLEWEAAKMPRLFPLMQAKLAVYALTGTETQLELSGEYEPPMGALGKAIDAIAGHKFAEASVHTFVRDVANHLRETLG